MLYTEYSSPLPMLDTYCTKVILRDEFGRIVTLEKVTELETDVSGNVVRVQVRRTTNFYQKGNGQAHFQDTFKNYTSRAWITRIMREYAHIAARRATSRLL